MDYKYSKYEYGDAEKMARSFFLSSGINCTVYDSNGELVFSADSDIRPVKMYKPAHAGSCAKCSSSSLCQAMHIKAIQDSRRFGGRYVYACNEDMAFCASPIIIHGKTTGALVCGPIKMMDVDPSVITSYSEQLFADTTYISDSTHEIFLSTKANERDNKIAEQIAYLKSIEHYIPYPIDTEKKLFESISRGDRKSSDRLLNELLGYIFFHSSEVGVIREMITELFVVLSRAAIRAGADKDTILENTRHQVSKLRLLNSRNDIAVWLAECINRYMNTIYFMTEHLSPGVTKEAVDYIKAHYKEKLTITDVSEIAGYSPSHFSRIFKSENGKTFREYLNEVRVEEAKSLLLSERMTTDEVSFLTGFSDQSYFCKVFRSITGVTPNAYKKRIRRIDSEKEHGL